MSLYYEGASILSIKGQSGDLKSRVFGAKNLRSPRKQLFALLSQAVKWSTILKEVIEKSDLLIREKKLTPELSLLLVYDLLISSNGLALSKDHALREVVIKHKARLSAGLTRVRVRNGFSSLGAFRAAVETKNQTDEAAIVQRPRWIRINTLRTSLKQELETTFAGFTRVEKLEDLAINANSLYIDNHISDLLAISSSWQAINHPQYQNGSLILQDKASCFPAVLLNPKRGDKCLDACAAPGNKTSHLAALLHYDNGPEESVSIWACEKDPKRAKLLGQMMHRAGAETHVDIQAGQDFLKLDPRKPPWSKITHVLLDPSCSGSGIIGRDDEFSVDLPSVHVNTHNQQLRPSKRRKRHIVEPFQLQDYHEITLRDQSREQGQLPTESAFNARLESLGEFQLRVLLHAFTFPIAKRITYSTCSLYAQENEHVVIRALRNPLARQCGWRIICRDDQPLGLQAWPIRGDQRSCISLIGDSQPFGSRDLNVISEGCIRCEKDTKDGTQGFFIAGFARDIQQNELTPKYYAEDLEEVEEEWEGFDDDDLS